MKLVLANCLKFSREDALVISFGSEFHNFGAVAENDLSKREVLDLDTIFYIIIFPNASNQFSREFILLNKSKLLRDLIIFKL